MTIVFSCYCSSFTAFFRLLYFAVWNLYLHVQNCANFTWNRSMYRRAFANRRTFQFLRKFEGRFQHELLICHKQRSTLQKQKTMMTGQPLLIIIIIIIIIIKKETESGKEKSFHGNRSGTIFHQCASHWPSVLRRQTLHHMFEIKCYNTIVIHKRMQRTPTCVLHTVFFLKQSRNLRKRKTQSNVFLLNQRPHVKIQLIWTTFKKRQKSSLTPFFHWALMTKKWVRKKEIPQIQEYLWKCLSDTIQTWHN